MEVERTFEQWSMGNTRIKWGAVFAGWAVGLALQMVLTLLGLGIGAWAIDVRDPDASGIPVGAAIWTGVSMLIAAFTGGYVTSRLSGMYDRSDGLYHGIVVWGVNWLIFAWLTTTAMASMIGGAFSVFGTTLQSLTQGMSGVASAAAGQIGSRLNEMSLSRDQLRGQIESILSATGKPELQPGQLQQDAERTADSARGGQRLDQVSDSAYAELRDKLMALDRQAAQNVLVNQFGLSEAQATQVVDSSIGMVESLKQRAQETGTALRERSAELGTEALDRMGTAALWLAALAIITLGLSALGGMLGTPEDALMEARAASESFRTDLRRAG